MQQTRDASRLFKEVWALILLFLSVLFLLSLFSYSEADPSFNNSVDPAYKVANQAGIIGAYLAGLLVDFFGIGSFIIPLLTLIGAAAFFFKKITIPWYQWLGFFLLFLNLITIAQTSWGLSHLSLQGVTGGGFWGNVFSQLSTALLRQKGAAILWVFLLLTGIQLSTGASWASFLKRLKSVLRDLWFKYTERLERKYRVKEKKERPKPSVVKNVRKTLPAKSQQSKSRQEKKQVPLPIPRQQQFPKTSLLMEGKPNRETFDKEHLEGLAEKVESCLSDFAIQGEVQGVQPGPVVTMVEFKPAPGVKISKISGLSSDLALALKAQNVRIVAPIPGKDTVGLEVPNLVRDPVYLREIVEAQMFTDSNHKVPLALGKDIQGAPVVVDLVKMPHMLVAGATGAGKSVCLNAIILSMLFKHTPETLRLLLIDPKRIELSVYDELPHLVHPVVTDMHMAKTALDWAVYEMEQRYEAMAKLGVRNIESFNKKIAQLGDSVPEDLKHLQVMPFIVIIIDELADLMMTAAKEVEVNIVRLAQLARAAGIHLIIATQRPSVDVVTGLIKANFPSRIAFQVSSRHDSRTILDTSGAESLLGLGDMLLKGSAGKMIRVHGCFVSDDDVAEIMHFWKWSQPTPDYLDLEAWKTENGKTPEGANAAQATLDDPQYQEALDFVMDQGKASISLIQRRLRIGFNKAARFIEQMEEDGVVGPQEGSKPRKVLKR